MASTIGEILHSNGKGDRRGSPSQDEGTPLVSHSPGTERAQPDDDLDDPAYDLVKRCMTDLNILHVLLHNGPDTGVDWDAATGASDRRSSFRFVSGSLRQHLKDCSSSALKDSPSAKLSEILEQCTEIADAVNAETERGRNVSKTCLFASSDIVQEWQAKLEGLYSSAQKMDACARGRPGTSSGMPLMTSHFNVEAHIAHINARSAQAQATLEAAKYRIHATQGVFVGFQENYTKASQDMPDQQVKMAEIQSALTELTQKNMGLQEAKIVLERCMMLTVKVKSSILNLCRFFEAMSLTIEAIVKHSVQPFLENIASGSSDDDQVAKIGNYTFTDLQRTILYHSDLTIKASFSVFGDIAAMWCELSEKYIMPGVHMLDQLSLREPDEQKRQRLVQDLQKWTERSTAGVKLIAETSQRDILESMERRVEAIQSVTKQLPPSAPMKEAIDAGTQESREVAAESIVAASAKDELDRFVPKRK